MAIKNRKKRRTPIAEINVVPYIDVMLVLLVIFMITAPLLSQGVNVNLPQASSKPIDNKEKAPIIVSIDASGNYYLNINSDPNKPMDPNALANRVGVELQAAQQSGQQRQVLVKGDKNVDYGKVIQAMVLLQNAGATSVGLITQPTPSKQ